MQAAYFPAQAASGLEYPFAFPGAVLSRLPLSAAIDHAAAVRSPQDHRFHRPWGGATVATGATPLRVASTHLCSDWGGVMREGTRLEEIACLLAGPPADLIAGDFNAQDLAGPIARMRAAGWRVAACAAAPAAAIPRSAMCRCLRASHP